MDTKERLEAPAEVDADDKEDSSPDGCRHRDAGGEDGVPNAEHSCSQGDRNPKPRDVAAENDREHPMAGKPPLGQLESLWAEVHNVCKSAVRKAAPEPSRYEEKVGRAQDHDTDQAKPGREPGQQVAWHMGADVHDEDVARHRERYA